MPTDQESQHPGLKFWVLAFAPALNVGVSNPPMALPLQARASIDAIQGQTGGSAGQAAHGTGRVRITTNWTDDDPTKPIIPGHLRQPDDEKVVVEIASKAGLRKLCS